MNDIRKQTYLALHDIGWKSELALEHSVRYRILGYVAIPIRDMEDTVNNQILPVCEMVELCCHNNC